MLIIGLIAALLFYIVLYWIYIETQAHFTGMLSFLNQVFLMPEPTIFFLLRGLIIITLFYVIADALLSPARRGWRGRRQKQDDAKRAKMTFRGVKPPREVIEDDDDSIEQPTIAPPRFSS
jgi:hypothetical protein